MVALRSDAFASSVLWHDGLVPTPVPTADLPTEADAVVVGAGYAGLSAAAEFARQGARTVLLEAAPLGTGASTRNGGMVIPELKAGPATLAQSLGPLAARLYAEVDEAFDHVESLTDTARNGDAIDCDYRRSGQLLLAHSPRKIDHLRALAAELRMHGDDVAVLTGDGLAEEIGSSEFPAGLLMARVGSLHPARFHDGLVRRALAAGVSIHEHTPARSIQTRPNGGALVSTNRGTIRTRHLLLTTNATADDLCPPLRRRVLPLGSFIIATEVLDPELARSISPRGRMMVDTRNLLAYWRLTPDGRLAFGGRRSLRHTELHEAVDHLYDTMQRVHPQLHGVRIDRAWGGTVAMTLDRLPHVGRVGPAWYATGCNGSGVALMPWLGERMARALIGVDGMPAFADLPHRRIPLDRWRRYWLPVAGVWFTFQDRR